MTTTTTTAKPRRGRATVPEIPPTVRRQPGASPAHDELTGEHRALVYITLDRLRPHPDNPRRDLGDLTELADSIRAHGVRQNLLVVPDPDEPDAFRLVIGHRRTAAAREAGLETLPAVVDAALTSAEQLELMLLENIQRSDLSAIEEADAYQGLLDLGLDEAEIAKKTGRSRTTVAARLRIRGLPEPIRQQVHAHQATLADADLLATTLALPAIAGNAEAIAELTDSLGYGGFAHRVERVVQAAELRVAQAAEAERLTAAGVKVVDAGEHGQAPSGVRRLYELAGPDGKELTDESHATCPGHVAWMNHYNVVPYTGCRDWKKYGHSDRWGSAGASSRSDLTTEQRREIVANNKAALAAEVVRRDWLRTELLSRSKMPADAALYVARILRPGHQPHYKEHDTHRALVGADRLVESTRPPATTVDQAMRDLVALAAAQVEVGMEKDFWRKEDSRRAQYAHHLATLASWGYELADVEQLVVDADATAARRRRGRAAADVEQPVDADATAADEA